MSTGEFSVYQFLDGLDERQIIQECVRQHVCAEEAFMAAAYYCNNVVARMGLTQRVIITDGGDCIVLEWLRGKGVVYPPEELWKKEA